ncbi:hypothetical protein DFH06DRAFT_1327859 [Mycena polygramma]|nr:hypothetical protein DFH06DRAFT_1327859 [Mycena polygramma]
MPPPLSSSPVDAPSPPAFERASCFGTSLAAAAPLAACHHYPAPLAYLPFLSSTTTRHDIRLQLKTSVGDCKTVGGSFSRRMKTWQRDAAEDRWGSLRWATQDLGGMLLKPDRWGILLKTTQDLAVGCC